MNADFCGNPFNHVGHRVPPKHGENHEIVRHGFWCEGVLREEVTEKVVEKWSPEAVGVAEDGTEYSKVTITIEDDKGATILIAPKASRLNLEVEHEKYVPLEKAMLNFDPEITRAMFSFKPHTTDEAPGFTVERKLKDDPA